MASLPVMNAEGKEVGQYELASTDFAPSISRQLLHDAVVMYQANLRLGTHQTKTRSEVAGSRKKMYRQKGTGNARAGHKRSGVRRGGGHIFAKRNRDYSYRLPRKALQAATRMAMASKVEDDQVTLVDGFGLEQPKTKQAVAMLQALGLAGQTVLVVTDSHAPAVYKSFRNVPGVEVSPVSDLNALALLKPSRVVAETAAVDQMKAAVAAKGKAVAAE